MQRKKGKQKTVRKLKEFGISNVHKNEIAKSPRIIGRSRRAERPRLTTLSTRQLRALRPLFHIITVEKCCGERTNPCK
jgi:MarR-like DNA-binding transcriptional regulator SgrR of sgrS sRNA